MTNPTAADINALEIGAAIKVNGKRFEVTGQFNNFTTIQGPRGGWANLVPSISGDRVQLTRHTSDHRDWVDSIEVA